MKTELSLTKAEEQIMQVLWKLNKGFVKDIIVQLPDPKPAYNTVSTIVRILETKGFVDHNLYGKTHEYFPLVTQQEYTRTYFKSFLSSYFSNSMAQFVSFFAKEENLSTRELDELMQIMQQKHSSPDSNTDK